MSRRELERASIFGRVKLGAISLVSAAPLLGLSYRQSKRLYSRYKAQGGAGLVHASLGRPSNRSYPSDYRDSLVSIIREHYGGGSDKGRDERFGPTLVCEHLWTDHGVLVPVRTLTRLMTRAGLWSKARRVRVVKHQRRERKAHAGELVQLDGSFHDWFEGRGGLTMPCLMTMVDDATGDTLLEFSEQETTWAAASVLQGWIAEYGVPGTLYTDWKNVYKRPLTSSEIARGETEAFTQFGRMCHKFGIAIIAASSPQAKGRVERAHGTHQDRLIKKMRLKGIATIEAANEFLRRDYTPSHNARFRVEAASEMDYHRPRNSVHVADRDVYCLEHSRVVGHDHVVQYETRGLQLDPRTRGRIPPKSKVLVRESKDGTLSVIKVERDGRDVSERRLKWTEAPSRPPRPPIVPTAATIEAQETVGVRIGRSQPPPKPGPDHPWRATHNRWVELARRSRAAQMQTTQTND